MAGARPPGQRGSWGAASPVPRRDALLRLTGRGREPGDVGGRVAEVAERVAPSHRALDRAEGLIHDTGAGVVVEAIASAGHLDTGASGEGVIGDAVAMGAVDEVHPALQVSEVAAVLPLAVDGEADVPVALRVLPRLRPGPLPSTRHPVRRT